MKTKVNMDKMSPILDKKYWDNIMKKVLNNPKYGRYSFYQSTQAPIALAHLNCENIKPLDLLREEKEE